jgi:hypothetical protein
MLYIILRQYQPLNVTLGFHLRCSSGAGQRLWCFEQYFSYIAAVSFITGETQSTRKKTSTWRMSLTIAVVISRYDIWNFAL